MPYLCNRLANTSRDMSKKTKLKIGEFSQLMQVTVKTLRHYEQKGLLVPDEVDEWTGYRYYSIDQMQQLKDIRDLQRLGFSLDEIKDLFDDGSHTPTIRQMTEKIRETEAQLKELIARRNQLLGWRNARKEMKTMEKFSFQSLPEIIVASHREVIPNYAAIGPMCVEKIGPEMHIEYCEQVEEMGEDSAIIQFKRLPAVPKALCMKHIGPYERFYESFTEAFRYIEEHGLKPVGQHRTCYIDGAWNQEDPEKWLSVIQIPIE